MERWKILVVDDEKNTRLTLEEALDPLGYEIVLAASGDEALERLADPRLALVLLDLKMREGRQVGALVAEWVRVAAIDGAHQDVQPLLTGPAPRGQHRIPLANAVHGTEEHTEAAAGLAVVPRGSLASSFEAALVERDHATKIASAPF